MAEGSGLSAMVRFRDVPLITPDLFNYLDKGSFPGGTTRNWDSYGHLIKFQETVDPHYARYLLADPQTSGGLLIAVGPESLSEVEMVLQAHNLAAFKQPIGEMVHQGESMIIVA